MTDSGFRLGWISLAILLAALIGGFAPSGVFGASLVGGAQQPYRGVVRAIPGRIEVEDFDLGGEGLAYHDATPGNSGSQYRPGEDVDVWVDPAEGTFIGSNASGEWQEFTVNVATAGAYTVSFRVGAPGGGRRIRLEFDGVDRSGAVTLPVTGGWVTWQTFSVPVTLTAGRQVMRLFVERGGFNLNWIEFARAGGATGGTVTNTATNTSTATNIAAARNTGAAAVATPTITPNGGVLSPYQRVTLSSATPGSLIYYTTDGTDPTRTSKVYWAAFPVVSDTTVKARAVAWGKADSAVASTRFTVSTGGAVSTTTGGSGVSVPGTVAGGVQQPYRGLVRAIPGRIEVEDFDTGGEGTAYHDASPGNSGGQYRPGDDVDIWVDSTEGTFTGANSAGEWQEFTVNVATAGAYTVSFRAGVPRKGKRIRLEFDGVDRTGAVTLPVTGGWVTWQTFSVPVTLTAGRQVMRLFVERGGFNLNWIEFARAGGATGVGTATNTSTATNIITATNTGTAAVATPTITPNGGVLSPYQRVTLSSATPGSLIYYTTDGTDPTRTSKVYWAAFPVVSDTTVKARAVAWGKADSAVASARFTVSSGVSVSTTTGGSGVSVPGSVAGGVQQPYRGLVRAIPGRIEVEDFDTGGEGTAYHDASPGNSGGQYRPGDDVDIWVDPAEGTFVGSISSGEWQEFTVNVATAGTYTVTFRAGVPSSGKRIRLEFDGVDRTGPVTIPNTGGWVTWQTFGVPVTLNAGQQVMRLFVERGGFNLNWIEFASGGGGSGGLVTTPTITPEKLKTLVADNFNDGNANGWTVVNDTGVSPRWGVKGGAYQQTALPPNDYWGWWNGGFVNDGSNDLIYRLGSYSYRKAGAGDYSYSVTVTPKSTAGNDDCGIIWRHTDKRNYYRLTVSYVDGITLLERQVGGVWKTLSKNGRGVSHGIPIRMEVLAKGPLMQVTMDGAKLFGVYDAGLGSGGIGVYARGQCAFDDVQVKSAGVTPRISISKPEEHTVVGGSSFSASAVVANMPVGARVKLLLDGRPCSAATERPVGSGAFQAQCTGGSPGVYKLTANLIGSDGSTLIDSDIHGVVGVGGTNLAAAGDSIHNGVGDRYRLDGDSDRAYGFRRSLQGFEARMVDLLNGPVPVGRSYNVFNVANPGDQSIHLAERIGSILEQQADADILPMLIGTNDAGIKNPGPRESGLSCGSLGFDPACEGTFYDYVQQAIDAINRVGKRAYVALIPPRFGRNESGRPPYSDPENDPAGQNAAIREYNRVIKTRLRGHVVGPDFYTYFLGGGVDRFFLFADDLHPNGLGNQVMAVMWNNVVKRTNPLPLPYIVDELCLRLTAGGACKAPMPYKEDLKEVGDEVFIDENATLSSIPAALSNGRWISTANGHRNQSNDDYLSFDVGFSPVSVYVAYDAGARSLPAWLSSGYTNTGLSLAIKNASARTLRLYRATGVRGRVVLGGANGAKNGAGSNYVVIVK